MRQEFNSRFCSSDFCNTMALVGFLLGWVRHGVADAANSRSCAFSMSPTSTNSLESTISMVASAGGAVRRDAPCSYEPHDARNGRRPRGVDVPGAIGCAAGVAR